MAASLRIRQDLQVAAAEDEAGVLYYDVSDPRTGGRLRLFDFEWLVAERIDGRSFEELARFAQSELGLETSAEDLQVYAQRLSQFGLLDLLAAEVPVPAPQAGDGEERQSPRAPLAQAAQPQAALPVAPVTAREPKVQIAPEVAAPVTPVTAREPSRPETVEPERREPKVQVAPEAALPVAPAEEPRVPDEPKVQVAPEPAPTSDEIAPTVPAMPALRPVSDRDESSRPTLQLHTSGAPADDVMGQPLVPAPQGPEEVTELAAPERKATLLMPTVVGVPASVEEPPRAPSSISERPTAPMPPIEPGAPAPAEAAEAPVARVTLPAADTAPVTPAERERPVSAEAPGPAVAPREAASPAVLVEAKPTASSGESGSLPIDASGEMSPPEEAAAPAQGARPVAPATDEDDEATGEGAGAGRWIALLVLLLALGLVAYLLFGLRRPPAAQVSVKRAQPHEVTRTLGAQAVVKKAAPQALRMDGGGVLASVVGEGAEVTAGMSLAVLQSHAKLQKEITDLKERLAYYQRRREIATEKGDEAAAKEAQAKVSEKEERLQAAEAAIKKAQLLATRSGKVSRVLVHAGDLVSPGSEIIEIADRFFGAEVLLPASETQGLKIGEAVQLEGAAAPLTARVSALEPKGAEVLVQLELEGDSAAKPGDALRLVRGRLAEVETLPSAAVALGDTVFVVSQGKAERRKVTVVDHRGSEVLVTGLRGGEEVVTSNAGELHEGQLVKPVYGTP